MNDAIKQAREAIKVTPEMIAAAEGVDDLYRMGQPQLWARVFRAMYAASPIAAPASQPTLSHAAYLVLTAVAEDRTEPAHRRKAALEALSPASLLTSQPDDKWYRAVTDACCVAHIKWDEENPYKSVNDLINWHVQVALDPAVSEDAAAIRNKALHDALAIFKQKTTSYPLGKPVTTYHHAGFYEDEIRALATQSPAQQEPNDGLGGLLMLVVRRPGMAPFLKRPYGDTAAYVREVFSRNPDAEIAIVRSWSDEVGCQTVEDAREFLAMEDALRGADAAPVAQQAFKERDLSKPAEQQGLFRKFDVRRVDGSDQPGGKHYGCRYYVLDLDHDQHAPAAMRAYAAACRETHPQLATDIEAEFGAVARQAGQQAPAGRSVLDECISKHGPEGCYRVRCQLGKECVAKKGSDK